MKNPRKALSSGMWHRVMQQKFTDSAGLKIMPRKNPERRITARPRSFRFTLQLQPLSRYFLPYLPIFTRNTKSRYKTRLVICAQNNFEVSSLSSDGDVDRYTIIRKLLYRERIIQTKITTPEISFEHIGYLFCRVAYSRYSEGLRVGRPRGRVRTPVGETFFSSPSRPERLWGPSSLLSKEHQGIFPRSRRGVRMTTQEQLSRSRIRGSIHPLPHTSSWRNV
jgi:hypothetical protein